MCMSVLLTYMMHVPICVSSTQGDQKRVLDLLQRELGMIVSRIWGLEIEPGLYCVLNLRHLSCPFIIIVVSVSVVSILLF